MRLILQGLFQRRFRTSLTILGVGVGIFGFVVMGAMAEKMNRHAANAVAFYSLHVWVLSDRGMFGIGGAVPVEYVGRIEDWEEVEYATARVFVPLDILDMGNPLSACCVGGVDLAPERSMFRMFPLRDGAYPVAGSRSEALLGDVVARKYSKNVGDTFEIKDRPFRVCGVLERLDNDADYIAFMSIDEARELYRIPESECTSIAVRPLPEADPEELARRIEESFDGVYTMSPANMTKHVESMTSFMNSFVYGATIVAVLAGALGIVNTMVMAVTERAREIATKKAIGASTSQLFSEFLTEAVVIAVIGGVVGIGLAEVAARGLNAYLQEGGVAVFLITGRLRAWAMLVSLVVGCLAGLYPALRAAKTDPVRILRSV